MKYNEIIQAIFFEYYTDGVTSIVFEREKLADKARELGIKTPKNLGDIVYSYKYRNRLPDSIVRTAPNGYYWRIRNIGIAQYEFKLTEGIEFIVPDTMSSIARRYSESSSQS